MSLRVVATAALLAAAAGGASSRRLRIRNGCSSAPLWIASEAGETTGPDPQNLKVEPGQFHDFTALNGPSSTRYWAKTGCNAQGGHCELGSSGGPGESCMGPGRDSSRCGPSIDSKLELSYGNVDLPCEPGRAGGCDLVHMSLVDGFTLPFKLEVHGRCLGAGSVRGSRGGSEGSPVVVDCSRLSLASCPLVEDFTGVGFQASLRAVNPETGHVAGCYSPCQKLVSTAWNNSLARGHRPADAGVSKYCCPKPAETDDSCRSGPASSTNYVGVVHRACTGVNAFAMDNGLGLTRCEARTTRYELTFFCPTSVVGPEQTVRVLPASGVLQAVKAVPAVAAARAALAVPVLNSCDGLCTYEGHTASCRIRIEWAMSHRFKKTADACMSAHEMVLKRCPSCAGCTLPDAGCTTRKEPSASPYDCIFGFFTWKETWSEEKKAWCCKHEKKGCADNTGKTYDCTGSSASWDKARRSWCCVKESIACPEAPAEHVQPAAWTGPAGQGPTVPAAAGQGPTVPAVTPTTSAAPSSAASSLVLAPPQKVGILSTGTALVLAVTSITACMGFLVAPCRRAVAPTSPPSTKKTPAPYQGLLPGTGS